MLIKNSTCIVLFVIINIRSLSERLRIEMDEKSGVEITWQEGVGIAAFSAASICDSEVIAAISSRIKGFIDESRPRAVIFDFEMVKFFSSQLLGVLLDVRAKAELYDVKVVISGINPQLYRVFRITNLDKIFRFFPDKESAVRAVNAN